jgi:hypothetical protein
MESMHAGGTCMEGNNPRAYAPHNTLEHVVVWGQQRLGIQAMHGGQESSGPVRHAFIRVWSGMDGRKSRHHASPVISGILVLFGRS